MYSDHTTFLSYLQLTALSTNINNYLDLIFNNPIRTHWNMSFYICKIVKYTPTKTMDKSTTKKKENE